MKVDGFEAKAVRTRSGLTLQWTDASGFTHVAVGLEEDVEKADASASDIPSAELDKLHLRRVV